MMRMLSVLSGLCERKRMNMGDEVGILTEDMLDCGMLQRKPASEQRGTRERRSTRQAPQAAGRLLVAAGLALGCTSLAWAQSSAIESDTPMPTYSAAQVLQSLYGQHLPARAAAFVQAAQAQQQTWATFCGQAASAATASGDSRALRAQWRGTLNAWLDVATPSVGPLVSRRSQRQIDFTPIRPQLITRAVQKAPATPADMELVGTPAKGFGALDWLLSQGVKASTPQCAYAQQVAQAITAEAQGIAADLKPLQSKVWNSASSEEEDGAQAEQAAKAAEETSTAMAEWVNQWLGALERLRWAQMEKPVQVAQSGDKAPAFARAAWVDNQIEWCTQWQDLRKQALLTPAQRQSPPVPGQHLIPIEALLLSKGQIELATRWRQVMAQADAAMRGIGASGDASAGALQCVAQPGKPASPQAVQAAATQLKAVTAQYQSAVAPALDIPLGFSDSDGD